MNYDETLAYIHGSYWTGTKPGLGRTFELLDRLGNPQKKLSFIHVAGTNGKGSTCALLASVLQAAGYKTGLYTSPYVNRFNERMAVNGIPICDEALVALFERIRPLAEDMEERPSEFELITAAAMVFFCEQGCDVVVLEVGMGGEWDSTNVIDTPLLSVITAMGFDHMQYLGNTMTSIASAKAGIIKPNGVTVIYGENPEADAVFQTACKERHNRLVVTDFSRLQIHSQSLDGQDLSFGSYAHLHLPLLGCHQQKNAALVLTALEELKGRGLIIPDEAVYQGFASVHWPARMELLQRDPVFLLDGAHNPHGFAAAAQTLQELFPGKRIRFLMGVMGDKDHGEMLSLLLPLADSFITVQPRNPRAMGDTELAAEIVSLGGKAQAAGTVENGLKLLLQEAKPSDVLVAIGSLYMAGDIRAAMRK
ncbi:MAG: bifunctional folylpolyglutamate synthase/dihydrofolate synthase [Clostridia bacterium]|nr:bifunctional folylpolyglutamate synthase/dihydrofolate synthase [Clostridia bacterium]